MSQPERAEKPATDKSEAIAAKVSASGAEALARLQHAAETIAADVAARDKKDDPEKKSERPAAIDLSAAIAMAQSAGVPRPLDWRKAVLWALIVAAAAVAALLGWRDSEQKYVSQDMAALDAAKFDQVAPWKPMALSAPSAEAQDLRRQARALQQEAQSLRAGMQKQADEIRALQAQVAAAAATNAQQTARLDRAERDSAAKLEQHNLRIERIERLTADPVVTSAIKGQTSRSAAAKGAVDEKDGSPHDFVLRSVRNGVAVVQTRRGLVEVGPGDVVPGAGRVRSIEKVDGRWVVVTNLGMIDAN